LQYFIIFYDHESIKMEFDVGQQYSDSLGYKMHWLFPVSLAQRLDICCFKTLQRANDMCPR